jgi:hypothetical protein
MKTYSVTCVLRRAVWTGRFAADAARDATPHLTNCGACQLYIVAEGETSHRKSPQKPLFLHSLLHIHIWDISFPEMIHTLVENLSKQGI